MADETLNRYGGLDPEAFEEINRQGEESLSTIRDISAEFRRLGSDIEDNYTKQATFAKSLASISASTLKEKKEIRKLETQVADTTREVTRLANQSTAIAERLAALTGKKSKAAEAERVALAGQLEKTITLKSTFEGMAKSAQALVDESKRLDSQTKFFTNLETAVKSIPAVGDALSGPFSKASAAAKEAAEKGVGKMNANLAGATTLGKELATTLGPAAVLGALFKVSDQAAQINRQLGLGTEAAARTRDRFAEIAQSSGSSRFNTEKLVQANANLNQTLGTSVEFSGEMLKSFIELTEYMGVSNEAAAKLATLGKITGQTSSEFAGNLALSVANANKANGVFVSTASAFEKIKNLSSTTLLNLRRNPQAIGEAIVLTEKLGLSFEQLKSTSQNLLDFESSISNELEAELLTGRQLNLERARSAALRGDDVALAKELATQVGTVAQFEKLNVIQRESLAKAFGMSADQMGDMLIKQEMMNKLGNEAKDLTNEQAAAIRKMVEDNPGMTPQQALTQLQTQESATKKFQDAVAKLKNVFTDIVSFLSPIVDKFGSFISSIASSGLGKMLMSGGIIYSLAAALKNIAMPRGSSPLNPLYTTSTGTGGVGGLLSTLPGGSRYGAAMRANSMGKFGMSRAMGMRGVGIGAVGALAGGLMMQSENEGVQIGGAALSGAGTGAMIGSVIPGIGTAVGAGLGAAIGGLTAYLSKKDKDEEKQKGTSEDKYNEMIKLLRTQAEKDTKIFMDANQVGIAVALGNPKMN